MCHLYKQNMNLKGIKRSVINQVTPIIRLSVFLYSSLALELTMSTLKRSAQEWKQPQHYYECPEWHHSIINDSITIPIAHQLYNHPASDSAVSSLRLYPTSAR